MTAKKLSVSEAAKRLNIGNDLVMAWLRSKKGAPFGTYIKQEGAKQGRYLIYEDRLEAYLAAEDITILGKSPTPPAGG